MPLRANHSPFRHLPRFRPRPLFSVLIVGAAVILAYHLVVGPLLLLRVEGIIKSCLMQVFGTLLPGMALYTLLSPRVHNHIATLSLSYALGYAFQIVSYFLFVPFGGHALIPYYMIPAAAFSGWIIWKRRSAWDILPVDRGEILAGILFLVYLLMQTISYSAANASPALTASAWIPKDLAFWLENAAALSIRFPAGDLRVYVDSTLFYHYFSSIQLAFSHLATGIDLFTLAVPLYSLGKSILVFGSFYVFLTGITRRVWAALLGVFLICFTNGLSGRNAHRFGKSPPCFQQKFYFVQKQAPAKAPFPGRG